MSDPIAPHSAPIAAYMSVHEGKHFNIEREKISLIINSLTATNLAYVRYFGKINNATKATFKSLDSRSFTLDYQQANSNEIRQITIPFKTALEKREEIRPVLEAMAKEAEEALGLVYLIIITRKYRLIDYVHSLVLLQGLLLSRQLLKPLLLLPMSIRLLNLKCP
jgi:hypothetical protein